MTWKDDLRRVTMPDGRVLIGASFRSVPFFVESSERSGGRRTVTHEFPGRDEHAVDDLGRRAPSFSLEGYVVGDDYVTQKNALIAALESGVGELVHPYYGRLRAVCSSFTTRESKSEGGLARLALDFTEVPAAPVPPLEVPDLAAAVSDSADAALDAVETELDEQLDTSGQPGYAVESLAADLTAIAEQLDAGLAAVVEGTQELARLNVEIASITGQATSLVRTPAATISALLDVLAAVADTAAAAPRKVLRALLDAYDVDAQPTAQGESEIREQERANQNALGAALRRLLVVEAARLLPDIEYETLEDALADRAAVADRLEEQSLTAADTAFPALVRLRSDVLRAIPGDQALERLVTVQRDVAVPSLLLAYQVYGSVEREDAVISRNQAQHPGFMAGALQVLSRG